MYDWDPHKQRIIDDYLSNLPWNEIERRNQNHGLFASKRMCQFKLKKWKVLSSARAGGHQSRRRVDSATSQQQVSMSLSESSLPDHKTRSVCSSLSQLLEPFLPRWQLENFEKFFDEERRKDYISPKLRSCCQLNVQANCPCRWCSIDDVHRLAINAPDKAMHVLKNLVTSSATEINKEDCFGNTPLHFLAATGKADFDRLMVFIEAGANTCHQNTCGETFLHNLHPGQIQDRLPQFLEALWESGFSFGQRDVFGRTALHRLYEHDLPKDVYEKIYQVFVKNGIRRHHRDSFGRSSEVLHEDIRRSKNIVGRAIFGPHTLVHDRKAICRVKEPWPSESPARNPMVLALGKALCQGNHEASFDTSQDMNALLLRMEDIIERSADNPELEDDRGNNAFHYSFWMSYFQKFDVEDHLEELLHYGVDINDFNQVGSTPLHTLISLPLQKDDDGRIGRYVKTFLTKLTPGLAGRFNIELRDINGQTILFTACLHGRIECVRMLFDYNANINVRNFKGRSILEACTEETAFWWSESQDASLDERLRENAAVLAKSISECMILIEERRGVETPDIFQEWSLSRNPAPEPSCPFLVPNSFNR